MVKKYVNTTIGRKLDLEKNPSFLIEMGIKRVTICEVLEEWLSELDWNC